MKLIYLDSSRKFKSFKLKVTKYFKSKKHYATKNDIITMAISYL